MNQSRFDGIPVMTAASNFRNIEAPPQPTDNYLTRERLLADAQGPVFRNLLDFSKSVVDYKVKN